MASLNKHYIGDQQSRTLEKKIEVFHTGSDINFRGFDANNQEDSIDKFGTAAHINRVLFWLSSKPNDYIREPNRGGILYRLIGTSGSDPNLRLWEKTITQRFNEEFAGDLDLLYINLSMSTRERKLNINMIVRDTILNNTFNVQTGAMI